MIDWRLWLSSAEGVDEPPKSSIREELRLLRMRRRQLINDRCSLRAFGFDSLAPDDGAALRRLDQKILALQLKRGSRGRASPGDPKAS